MMLWSLTISYLYKMYCPWLCTTPVIGTLHAPEKDAAAVDRSANA
jgi:hypothetical protein